jgi:hypothetical protein
MFRGTCEIGLTNNLKVVIPFQRPIIDRVSFLLGQKQDLEAFYINLAFAEAHTS